MYPTTYSSVQNLCSGSENSLNRLVERNRQQQSATLHQQLPFSYYHYNEPFARHSSPERLGHQYNAHRRYSTATASSSHENILLNAVVHIDPRYRDSRPFVNSSSELSRPRSASSSSLLLSQRELDQLRQRDQRRCSFTTDGHFGVMPSIYIEEYKSADDIEQTSNNSTSNLSGADPHQPLNEESIASIAGDEEIPFIDDDDLDEDNVDGPSDSNSYLPPRMGKIKSAGIMMDANRRGSGLYRKTVSFDLLDADDDEDDAKDRGQEKEQSFIPKSVTCGSILFNFNERGKSKFDELFKKCSVPQSKTSNPDIKEKKCPILTDLALDLTSLDDDNSESDEPSGVQSVSVKKPKIVPIKIEIESPDDLPASNGVHPVDTHKLFKDDKTNINRKSKENSVAVDKSSDFKVIWSSFNDAEFENRKMVLGEGKVRALTKFFDQGGYSVGTNIAATKKASMFKSTPNLTSEIERVTPTFTTTTKSTVADDKLSLLEQKQMLRQLKEWSKYGSAGRTSLTEQNRKSTLRCEINDEIACMRAPMGHSQSLVNLPCASHCRVCKKVLNQMDDMPVMWQSTPQLDESTFLEADQMNGKERAPDAFIVRQRNKCCGHKRIEVEDKKIPMRGDWRSSCPSLWRQNSPPPCCGGRSGAARFLTVRNVKRRDKLKGIEQRRRGRTSSCDVDGCDDGECELPR